MTAVMTILLCSLPLLPQAGPPAAELAAMKKLDFMVGKWEGSGWMEFRAGQRSEFTSSETVERKLGGVVLLIEGMHQAEIPGQKEPVTVHHALAVLAYDAQAKEYRMRSYLATGRQGDFKVELHDKGFVWQLDDPRMGTARYTMTLDEPGRWIEVGEMREDDGWRKFFEMKLTRTDAAGGGD